MSQEDEFYDSCGSNFSQKFQQHQQQSTLQKQVSFSSFLSKEGLVDPPRQLPKRSYSLQPDMATGWKPKKSSTNVLNNVFPLNCQCYIVDQIIKELYRKKNSQWQISYLGPRFQNSYMLHENKRYDNPYPLSKKLEPLLSQRPCIPINPILAQCNLKFNSNFQCGNLDAAICINNLEYDLFMRVDTNTKGHTNWYYFTVQNHNFVGSVRFNILNFRRDKSLYQRGLKPYGLSKKNNDQWKQIGDNIKYERRPLRYKHLYEQQQQELLNTLKTYLCLSFTITFSSPNDTLQLSYFIPYSYSRLLKFLGSLSSPQHEYHPKYLPPLKSLSGLSIPILQITDQSIQQYEKKVVVVTGRIHPGEAVGSFVAQGFLEFVTSMEQQAQEYRKSFITYVIPMLNPDGVVAGNYRTSLFGKDLNRTFNQNRKYAFPQTFHLYQLLSALKTKHKQRFTMFIDLHGHSVKKNIFMYGPQFNIQHPNYYLAKQLPKILSSISPFFRFYSCIFRISSQKSSTARAKLNRHLNIPFTYTMQSSNGFYYDSEVKKEFQMTSKKLKKMGMHLAQALILFKQGENSIRNNLSTNNNNYNKNQQKYEFQDDNHQYQIKSHNQNINQNNTETNLSKQQDNQLGKQQDKQSDDYISQGNSDSQPSDQDLSGQQLQKLLQTIIQPCQSSQKLFSSPILPIPNQVLIKSPMSKPRYKKKSSFLPPINCLNRIKQRVVAKSFIQTTTNRTNSPEKERRTKMVLNQMVQGARNIDKLDRKDQQVGFNMLRIKVSKLDFQKTKFIRDKF